VEFELSEDHNAVISSCSKFAQTEIVPVLREIEESREFPKALFRKIAEMGLLSMTVPESEGGSFGDSMAYVLAMMTIAKVDAGITVGIGVTNMVAEAISRFGTPEQKKKYLPLISSGKITPCSLAITESQAGSDVASLCTVAGTDADGFVLNGDKMFVSHGDAAGLIIVIAKTGENRQGTELTAFIVETPAPGLIVGRKEEKLGMLSSTTVSLRFENCRVPRENVLGKVGQGFKIAMSALDGGRIGIAAQAVGIAEAAFEACVKYANEREQFGVPIYNHQAVQFKIVDMKVKIEAAKLLMCRAAWLKDQKRPFTEEASMAKLFASEAANEIVGDAVQIHGGYGYTKEYPVEKYLRDARVTTIYEGTSEIQRIVIARKILDRLD
jgi:alkylation response protein AidB-like acyl-CoA dehydrogenase